MMSDLNEKQLKELIDSFVEYRKVLIPVQESLKKVGETYEAIKGDLDSLTRSFSGNVGTQLERIHSTLSSQSKSGQELTKRIDDFAHSSERYTQAVNDMTKRFSELSARIEAVTEIEKGADTLLEKLEAVLAEKRATYNLKELQRSLDGYNKNVEKISEFINKDVAAQLTENAEKIEAIRRDNEALSAAVNEQGKTVAELCATFSVTSSLLKKTVESGSVNEQYLFDAFDKWAADRKVKIHKK